MKLKRKSWLWDLTWPFAHNNWTTIGNTVYCPRGRRTTRRILAHEQIHIDQQKEVGVLRFMLLYLFCLPFIYNPWRWQWEFEAYTLGSKLSPRAIRIILGSRTYGWLRCGKN